MKYNFFTGSKAIKKKKVGYKYLGKKKIGNIKSQVIEGKRFYYLVIKGFEYSRCSPMVSDKSKFKKVEYEEWEYREDHRWKDEYIEEQKPKEKLIFNTKIVKPKKRILMNSPEIKLGKEDCINFFRLNESNIIKDLQLKEGDKLKITIEKKESKTKK